MSETTLSRRQILVSQLRNIAYHTLDETGADAMDLKSRQEEGIRYATNELCLPDREARWQVDLWILLAQLRFLREVCACQREPFAKRHTLTDHDRRCKLTRMTFHCVYYNPPPVRHLSKQTGLLVHHHRSAIRLEALYEDVFS